MLLHSEAFCAVLASWPAAVVVAVATEEEGVNDAISVWAVDKSETEVGEASGVEDGEVGDSICSHRSPVALAGQWHTLQFVSARPPFWHSKLHAAVLEH